MTLAPGITGGFFSPAPWYNCSVGTLSFFSLSLFVPLGHPEGRRLGGLPARPRLPDKRLDRGMTFNGSQRWSCSATHDTPTQNQVVYESFSTRFNTNLRCAIGEGAALVWPHPGPFANGSARRGPPRGTPRLRQTNRRSAALRYRYV